MNNTFIKLHKAFEKIDIDDSGTLDLDEVIAFIVEEHGIEISDTRYLVYICQSKMKGLP